MTSRVRNDRFDAAAGFDRGRPVWIEAGWYLCKILFFLSAFPWPSAWKVRILCAFGARVGEGVVIKPRVNIHFPWRLTIGDHAWIGEEAWLLNLAEIDIGAHCCISQRAFLCTGNHDYRRSDMAYRNSPIRLEDGAWVGAQSFVGPGVTIGCDAVVAAGSIVTRDLPAGMVCAGSPCVPIRPRWAEGSQH